MKINRHRSIIFAKSGDYWIYAYLYAKKDRANIDDDELAGFRQLAKAYSLQTDITLNTAIENGDLIEICHEK